MKQKLLLILPLLILMVASILALDYSITSDKNIKTAYSTEKVSFDAWHNDAMSNKKLAQGQGTLVYIYDINNPYGNYKKTLNLNLKEIDSYEFGNWIYSVNKATGTYWGQGSLPVQLKDIIVSYWYDKSTGLAYISTPGLYISNLIVKNK